MRNPLQRLTTEPFLLSKSLRGLRLYGTRAAFLFLTYQHSHP